MSLASASGGEDDYGWDVSLEDEQLFSNLVDQTAAPFAHPDPPGTGSDTNITTACRAGTTIRQPLPAISTCEASIPGAFPPSPRTETMGDSRSVADTTSADTGFYKDEPDEPAGYWDFPVRDGGSPPKHGYFEEHVPSLEYDDESTDISYPDLSAVLPGIDAQSENPETEPVPEREPAPEAEPTLPTKSPLARWRTFPLKPLSVTDFMSGDWCELQHEFTLTHLPYGKKTRTNAMRGGSRVHKKLEEEVRPTVRIEIISGEDAFGLRMWNIIQGLRTLREGGVTRELEVWGLVDGHVVTGLIDGLSMEHLDPDFEEEIFSRQGSQNTSSQKTEPLGQQQQPQNSKITEFFSATNDARDKEFETPSKRVWLTDVKTRGHFSLPSGAHMRPTTIQLFMYHRFLSIMADGKLDYLRVCRRYGLDPDEPFSDLFVAQIGGLSDEIYYDTNSRPGTPSSSGKGKDTNNIIANGSTSSSSSPNEMFKSQTLRALISLLKAELRQTFPHGSRSLGRVVTIEYRYRGRYTGDDEEEAEPNIGEVIGYQNVHVDDEKLQKWLEKHMEWWRGERAAEGVSIEEADKCRTCEFADICEWRAENHKRLVQQAREKRAAELGKKWRKYG